MKTFFAVLFLSGFCFADTGMVNSVFSPQVAWSGFPAPECQLKTWTGSRKIEFIQDLPSRFTATLEGQNGEVVKIRYSADYYLDRSLQEPLVKVEVGGDEQTAPEISFRKLSTPFEVRGLDVACEIPEWQKNLAK